MMTMRIYEAICLSISILFLPPVLGARCERLKASLTYTQEKAPRDLSGVLPVVVERINRELEGVVDVEVEWTGGDLHGKVGEHLVQCRVTRLASAVENLETTSATTTEDGKIIQCFELPFTIQDTNECRLPVGHTMRHQCQSSALCVNTVGSYECLCPQLGSHNAVGYIMRTGDESFWNEVASQDRSLWEMSLSSNTKSSCPAKASTHGCCPSMAHTIEGKACRSAFSCPVNPCSVGGHDCSERATCTRDDNPQNVPNYTCQCPAGLMGNGHKCRSGIDPKPRPMVKFDGVTPTQETVKNNYYCDCTKPSVDPCQGFPPCTGNHEICTVKSGNKPVCDCKPGWIKMEGYGCVDEVAPLLKLRNDPNGDKITRLKQGDIYMEHAVDIVDENAEEYMRSLRITYSEPLPHGCLTKVGEFHVNYTVATPWTTPPYVRVTRRVIIEDIDECTLDVAKYTEQCPQLIPQCDSKVEAKCVNTYGSYKCECPKYTAGDGFMKDPSFDPDEAPPAFRGGTSCVDNHRPVVTVVGPNPKLFKVCKCGGLSGIMTTGKSIVDDMGALCASQREKYDGQLKELIRSTAGAELCATHGKLSPKPAACVKAIDDTHRGPVDLSTRVTVGDPIQKTDLTWRVPYDVADTVGNKAKTVWRDVVVEEVELQDLEKKVRLEVMEEKEREIKVAVDKALAEDRKAREELEIVTTTTNSKRRSGASKACPTCPKCECVAGSSVEFDQKKCDAYCDKKISAVAGSCPESSGLYGFFYDKVLPFLFWGGVGIGGFLIFIVIIRILSTLAFSPANLWGPGAQQQYYNDSGIYETGPSPSARAEHSTPASLFSQRARANTTTPVFNQRGPDAGGGIFSPQQSRTGFRQGQAASSPFLNQNGTNGTPTSDNIYASSDRIITPNRKGELRYRRGY